MGTVAQKIAYLNETKELIKESLNTNFNSQIEDTDTFRSYVSKISDLYINWPKVEGEGTNLTLNNTRKGKMSNVLRGNINQESTTGKNLCPIDNSNFTATSTWSSLRGTNANTYTDGTKVHLTAGTYTISFSDYSNLDAIQVFVGGYTVVSTITGTFTLDTEGDIYIRVKAGNNTSPIKFKTQLEIGTTVTDWEKYTGGQPSPNPDYPQDVHVVSGNNTIVVEGKNLFSSQMELGTIDNYTGLNANSGNSIRSVGYIRVQPNTTYTISSTMNYHVLIHEYKADKSYIQYDGNYESPRTFTTTENTYYIRVRSASSQIENNLNAKYQLELGGTPSSYEEYLGNDYEINLGTMELCKIGDYQDYIYKDNDKWYKHSEIGKRIFNGTENWYENANNIQATLSSITFISNSECFSNYFKSVLYSSSEFGISVYQSGNTPYVRVNQGKTKIGGLSTFKAWLSSHNTTLYYPLATSTNTEITDQTLIAQLNNFKKAKSYNSQTNISQENNGLPFIINAVALMGNSD